MIVWANPSAHDVLGHARNSLIGTPVADLIADGDRDRWRSFVAAVLDDPAVSASDRFSITDGGGSVRQVGITAHNRLADPRIEAIVLGARDLAGDVEAGPLADGAADRCWRLFRDSPDMIFEVDLSGRITLVNPAAVRVFGGEQGQIIGRRFIEFVRRDHQQPVLDHYRRQVAAGERASYLEFPLTARGDGEVWVGQSAWLVLDDGGRPIAIGAMARDIGERRRADEALRQAQKMEAVGRLAGGIAHDFNNLLTAIRGNAELLAHRFRANPAGAAEVEEIIQAADRAASMTRQLLAFSRKQEVVRAVLDLNALVDAVARLARRLLGPDIALEVQPARDLRPVMADASQLEQLLLNLVLNARDALPDGGRIIVRTANIQMPDSAPESSGVDVPAGPYVLLQVIDNGMGMDRATQARVFEPFFTTKEPGRGTGLGLATVYGIVRQMGGAVTVTSERDKGATFSVYIPAASADAAARTEDLDASPRSAP